MSFFYSEQKVYCRACGKKFETKFQDWGGEVCSRKCWRKLAWIKHLSMLGKRYMAVPKSFMES